MATIAPTNMRGNGVITPVTTTMTSSDTFTYNASRNPVLRITNGTGSAVTVTIDGDGATAIPVPGWPTDVDPTGGYSTGSLANDATVVIRLASISAVLSGTIAVTGGSGCIAELLEF